MSKNKGAATAPKIKYEYTFEKGGIGSRYCPYTFTGNCRFCKLLSFAHSDLSATNPQMAVHPPKEEFPAR